MKITDINDEFLKKHKIQSIITIQESTNPEYILLKWNNKNVKKSERKSNQTFSSMEELETFLDTLN